MVPLLPRMLLVLALAVVVGFGVARAFDHGSPARQAVQSGVQLEATLSNSAASVATERRYDNPSNIGLVARGTVIVVGIAGVASMRSKVS